MVTRRPSDVNPLLQHTLPSPRNDKKAAAPAQGLRKEANPAQAAD